MTFLLIAVIGCLIYFCFIQKNNIKNLKLKINELADQLRNLEKYKTIVDLEKHVLSVKADLEKEISEHKIKASIIISECELKCKNEKEASHAIISDTNLKADQILLRKNSDSYGKHNQRLW
jgi:hypothetical protein